jgi:hypothetical protein
MSLVNILQSSTNFGIIDKAFGKLVKMSDDEIENQLLELHNNTEYMAASLVDQRFEGLPDETKQLIIDSAYNDWPSQLNNFHNNPITMMVDASLRFPDLASLREYINQLSDDSFVNDFFDSEANNTSDKAKAKSDFKQRIRETVLQHLAAPNAQSTFHLYNGKDYGSVDLGTSLLTPQQQEEMMRYLKGRSTHAQYVMSKNYQMADKLHNLVERVYRSKQGTPEHDRIMIMLLQNPKLVGVNPQTYHEALEIGQKHTAGEIPSIDGGDTNPYSTFYRSDESKVNPQTLRIYPSNSNDEAQANLSKILSWFKDDWRRALTVFAQKEGSNSFHNAVHQFGNILPEYSRNASKGMKEYFWQWVNKCDFDELVEVLKSWPELSPEETKLSPADLVRKIVLQREGIQENAESPFLAEYLRWHGSESNDQQYQALNNHFQASQAVPLPKWAQNVQVSAVGPNGKLYYGHFLKREDVRGMFLGNYTSCCQHPGGAGEECAYHGQCSPYGAFFVVTDAGGRIIAQSWTWESAEGDLTFDNIETRGLQGREQVVMQLYEKAAEAIGADNVRIGEGHSKIDLGHLPLHSADADEDDDDAEYHVEPGYGEWLPASHWQRRKNLIAPADYGGYSDASSRQYALKELGKVNYLPADRHVRTYDDNDNNAPVVREKPVLQPWMIENPYSSRKVVSQANNAVFRAKIADESGRYQEADKWYGMLEDILTNETSCAHN